MVDKTELIGSTAAFVAHPQFWAVAEPVFGPVLASFCEFGAVLGPEKLPRNTGFHLLSVTNAAVVSEPGHSGPALGAP